MVEEYHQRRTTKTKTTTTTTNIHHPLLKILETYSVWIGLLIRLILAWILPLLFDIRGIVPGVAYTDIDYNIFVDAATHVVHGASPYDRHTYRYTPLLAVILSKLPKFEIISRYLFCFADTICGYIILHYRRQKRRRTTTSTTTRQQQESITSLEGKDKDEQQQQSSETTTAATTTSPFHNNNIMIISPDLQDALWWLYNPLAINICTRGSSESFQVLLPVLLTVTIVTNNNSSINSSGDDSDSDSDNQSNNNNKSKSSSSFWNLRALVAGFWHGVAVHSKLYPIIYSLSFMTYFATITTTTTTTTNSSSSSSSSSSFSLQKLLTFVLTWAKRLLTPAPIIFFITFLITTVGLTYLGYIWYGQISLQEGLLYHFSRVDHRHNYSMHWYWIYLGRARIDFTKHMAIIGKLLLLPQLCLLVYTSLQLAPNNLGLALFVQTYLFVTQNKVITAQYLTWYLCLLPLCSDFFRLTSRLQWSLGILAISYGLWLGSAYCLEMQGWAVHRLVWVASCVYYWANVNVIGALLNSHQHDDDDDHHHRLEGGGVSSHQSKAKLS